MMIDLVTGHMTVDMIFDEFPELVIYHSWDALLLRSLLKAGVLDGYYNTSDREPVITRASLLVCIRSMNTINQMRLIDLLH